MVRRFLCFLLLTVLVLSFSSCSKDSDDNNWPQQETIAKTVFIYMPWTGSETSSRNSLDRFFNQNLQAITEALSTSDNSDTRIIVFKADNARQASLFSMDARQRKILRNYAKGNMTTTMEMTALLNAVAEESPSKIYAMIVGSHADGWLAPGAMPYKSRSFGGQDKSLQTDVTTLSSAIASSTIGKMQYICFDACYMANIETAYELRNVTQYLIASTSEIIDEGMPYANVWQYLSATTPQYNKITDAYLNYYKDSYGSLSAIDCSVSNEMAQEMRAINATYTFDTTKLPELQVLDGYTSPVFFDMESYIDHTVIDLSMRARLHNLLDRLVPYKVCTPSLYTIYQDGYTYPVNTFSGITISDPTENRAALATLKNTSWWKATHQN
jgi:hypothetical protein